MKVNYEDIKTKDYKVVNSIMETLQAISRRSGELLEVECISPREGWIPSMAVLTGADKITIDGRVVKNRYENINT